jgi:hypothetical protein
MLTRQWRLQVGSFKRDPITMIGAERAAYVTINHTALIKELGEALDEIHWKDWEDNDYLNREQYVKELVDALHFLMNLLLIAVHRNEVGTGSISDLASEIYSRYFDKAAVNAKRQEEGYDGVSTKCSCGRDVGDLPRGELVRPGDAGAERGRICPCGRWHPDAA